MTTQQAQPSAETQQERMSRDEVYAERAERFTRLRISSYSVQSSLARLSALLFFGMLALIFVGLVEHIYLVSALGLISGAACVYFFIQQGRCSALNRRYGALALTNQEARARLRRDWGEMPLRQPPGAPAAPTLALDLDLLGHASLQHLLNTPTTPTGQALLQSWLLEPADAAVIARRQAAARELAPLLDLRDELVVFGRNSGMTQAAYERFIAWAESDLWLHRRPWLLWLARVMTVLTILGFIVQFTGLSPYPLWLPCVAVNILITYMFGKPIDRIVDQVAERQAVFQPYAGVFVLIERTPFTSEALTMIQAELAADALNADQQMRLLGRAMQFGDLRLSVLFPALQAAFLWNFHALWLLERWQQFAGPHVRSWLEHLAEIEALAALATLAYDHPTWTFPELAGMEESVLTARGLGHPLLPPERCVGNDVSVGPEGTFLLVTGSNMSGKSTLLRAIGTNVVLAQAGAPVCAEWMRLPPIALATSMRAQDSLEYGVSYFMAEVQRLKVVVDTVRAARVRGARRPLFLLDEILHGTNTTERHIAARFIIRSLVGQGAIGVVTTHDLALAASPDLQTLSQPVYFTEYFTREPDGAMTMRFDYHLRAGIATSSNALKVMEMVGLNVDDTWQ